MKFTWGATVVIVALLIETICAGKNNAKDVVNELAYCHDQLATKAYVLTGTFFNKSLISKLLDLSYDMYYKKHMPLNEIANYYIKNFQNVGLQAEQIDTIVATVNNLAKSMNGSNEFVNFYSKIGDTLLQTIGNDQKQIDKIVAKLRSQHASDKQIKLSVCQEMMQRTSNDRILRLVMEVLPLVPADIQQKIMALVRSFFGLPPGILPLFNLIGSIKSY